MSHDPSFMCTGHALATVNRKRRVGYFIYRKYYRERIAMMKRKPRYFLATKSGKIKS